MNTPDRSGCGASRHGTMCAYTRYGCRCADAREAKRRYVKRRKAGVAEVRQVDATGSARRVQALMLAGHSYTVISDVSGLSCPALKHVSSGRVSTVYAGTAAKIRAAFEVLWDKAGSSAKSTTWARKQGFAPALAWDDATIDDPTEKPQGYEKPARVVVGKLPPDEELLRLIEFGESNAALAGRYRVSEKLLRRQLERIRARARAQENVGVAA